MSNWKRALASLFAEHQKRLAVLTYRRTGDWDVAEELVQDSFARLCSAGSSGSPHSDTKRLYAVARHAAIDYVRTQSRRDELMNSLVPEQWGLEPPSLDSQVEVREELTLLDAALDELSDKTKQVFVLRRYYGRSNAETAEALKMSVSSVEKHLALALRHCQQRLRDSDGEA
jgi:RNA polymerase sigma-70 factor (ECF subfamily)